MVLPFRDARLQSQCREKSASYRNQKKAFAEMRDLRIFIYCREKTRDEHKCPVAVSFYSENWPFIFKVLFTKCTFTWCSFYTAYQSMGVTKTVQFNETISSSDFQRFRNKWDHKFRSAFCKIVKTITCIACSSWL